MALPIERQLERIADKAELHRFIDEMPEDAAGLIVLAGRESGLEDEGVKACHSFGRMPLTHRLGLMVWATSLIQRDCVADNEDLT